jgi:pilus assembly protein CpaB
VATVGMSRRTIALVLAVALAALATIALISYIKGLEDEAFKGSEIVEVFVAKQDIAAGVSGDTASQQSLIERRTVPSKVRPAGAITSLQEISGRIAAVQIFKDEVIVGQRFVTPGAAVKGVLPIPEGKHAISIQVGNPAGVGGFVQPGDKISMIVQAATGGRQGQLTQYLLQNIDVLAVGSRVVSQTAAPAGQQQQQQQACCLFTLALTPVEAEQLVVATLNGQVYFTLVPEKAPVVRTPGRTVANLFG